MKFLHHLVVLLAVYLSTSPVNGQVPAYYSGINFSQSGLPLKNDLANLIISTHTSPVTYDDVWTILQLSDLDPSNSAKVLLAYGYDDTDGSVFNDRTRTKTNYGGSSGQWNREHTFAKSLGNPDLGTSGPGSDAHNLRASDVDMNNMRGSLLFADGSGDAGTVGANWYPGDEWKGDCARIIMYMYLRYSLQCRPYFCAVGAVNSVDANMVNVLLDWNAEDPVSQLEETRNDVIQSYQGNRNPFIDNPYIATRIWGGTAAEDTWGGLNTEENTDDAFTVFPIPANEHEIYVTISEQVELISIELVSTTGQKVETYTIENTETATWHITDVPSGYFIIQLNTADMVYTKKLVVL
ncbi:MAG: endonuclease [Crocinitomicaceae bacterium]|nr:endonuclease [Crocinitomicaceae bacterium]MBK8926121.1 endonuclease [Crocinitomicaceae bacterium]